MKTNFGESDLSSVGDFVPFVCFKKQPNFPFGPWTIVHGGQNRIGSKNLGMALPVLEIFAHFFASNLAKIPFLTMDYTCSSCGQKIELAYKIYTSRGCCEMHAPQVCWAWPFHFFACFKNSQISRLSMRSKNRISSKNSCK